MFSITLRQYCHENKLQQNLFRKKFGAKITKVPKDGQFVTICLRKRKEEYKKLRKRKKRTSEDLLKFF